MQVWIQMLVLPPIHTRRAALHQHSALFYQSTRSQAKQLARLRGQYVRFRGGVNYRGHHIKYGACKRSCRTVPQGLPQGFNSTCFAFDRRSAGKGTVCDDAPLHIHVSQLDLMQGAVHDFIDIRRSGTDRMPELENSPTRCATTSPRQSSATTHVKGYIWATGISKAMSGGFHCRPHPPL